MDLIDFFWNIRQQQQIGDAMVKAEVAASDARAHEVSLADLNGRFERLALVTQALSELLSERAHVTDNELLAKIDEIDTRDRSRHGGDSGERRSCPACGHDLGGHRTTCLYCGAPLHARKPFDGL